MSDEDRLFARDLRLARLFFIFLAMGLIWIATDHLSASECIVTDGFYGRMLGSLCKIIGPFWMTAFLFSWAAWLVYYAFSIKLKHKIASAPFRRNPFK